MSPRLLNQLSNLVKNSLDVFLAPAEDPRKTFADPYERQGELLERVRASLLENIQLRKRLELRIAELRSKIPALEQSARLAVAEHRNEQARLCLQQRHLVRLELQSLEGNCQEIQMEAQRIAVIEQRLSAQRDAMRLRQQVTAARYTSAESQMMAAETMSEVARELGSLGETLERAEKKTEYLQARAAALEQWADLDNLDLTGDLFMRQFSQTEMDEAINAELRLLQKANA